MRFFRDLSTLFSELFAFARERKAWWIVPIVIVLLLVGAVLVAVSTVSPFIYPLF